MAQQITAGMAPANDVVTIESRPAYQSYQILHWGFVFGMLVGGVDIFLHLLVNWDRYLAPAMMEHTKLSVHAIMSIIGVTAIIISMIIAIKPRYGAYLAALFLACSIANLILLQSYYDIALRDFILFLAALALGRLSTAHDQAKRGNG